MYNTILVPLDGSKRAETIVNHVVELARSSNSKLILLTVVEPKYLGSEGMTPTSIPMENFVAPEVEIENAKTYLAGLQKEFAQKDIQAKTTVISGSPVAVIKEIADKENVDLIAIASHGRGGLERVFYGSVAAAVLNQVDRPLFLIRSQSI